MFRNLKNIRPRIDLRKTERIAGGSNMSAKINGVSCDLLDYSTGGVRIQFNGEALQNATIEIFRQGQLLHEATVVLVWKRGNEAGYAFE